MHENLLRVVQEESDIGITIKSGLKHTQHYNLACKKGQYYVRVHIKES